MKRCAVFLLLLASLCVLSVSVCGYSDGQEAPPLSILYDSADFDIDGDGKTEHCSIAPGPTSGLYSIVLTARADDGVVKYQNTFVLPSGSPCFSEQNGKWKFGLRDCVSASGQTEDRYTDISVRDGQIVLDEEIFSR